MEDRIIRLDSEMLNKLRKTERGYLDILDKINSNTKLTRNEEFMGGVRQLFELKDIHLLDEAVFKNYKFHNLYVIYNYDLSFSSTYYKKDPNKYISSHIPYDKLKSINDGEFDENKFKRVRRFLIEKGVYIPIQKNEVIKDQAYLKSCALIWAKEMLNERHSDRLFLLLSKETRDTIRKSNIERYIKKNEVSHEEELDVFKAILKSKFIYNKALMIFEDILDDSSDITISFLGETVHFTFESIIHILNRHYAELLSNDSIAYSKSFHNTKIDPRNLHKLLQYFLHKIDKSGLIQETLSHNFRLYLRYYKEDYALYIGFDKFDKTKFIIKTFYRIDNSISDGEKDVCRITHGHHKVQIDDNLELYVKN